MTKGTTIDYEKLGVFYLGRPVVDGAARNEPVLYDAADLTTHAVIIGMTGSGKTGLGIDLIEEAALDKVPVIALDPKGDLGNLLLTFPALAPTDFAPWVDARAAANAGQETADFANAEAQRWREGLQEWEQNPDRIARLRAAADFALYTPGSTAGLPISVLASLAAPAQTLRDDGDLYRQHVQGVAGGILMLAGIEADPVSSREHILLSMVLDQAWRAGRDLDLPGLIGAVQQPGVTKVGVLDLDVFYPPKERFALALRLNNLLAAPGFAAWTQGENLDAGRLLFTPEGRPRVSILSIAHLGDAERMFFVTLLLNDVIAWMRSQPGTSSLRAILYMDEVFGYLPPVAMPPSKNLLLTLLKQARAYGLGVVLATQNPVDLDYKALANAGTWFIGRLQTAQDRQRVRDGLLSAAAGASLDGDAVDRLLAGLGKRQFLLHNVHESMPVVMQTRWSLSYLRGPLTREDIRRLKPTSPATASTSPGAQSRTTAAAYPAGTQTATATRPLLPTDVPVYFVEPARMPERGERLIYEPCLLGIARLAYLNAKLGVDVRRELGLRLPLNDTPANWEAADSIPIGSEQLANEPEPDAAFADFPAPGTSARTVKAALTMLRQYLRNDAPLLLWRSPELKVTSLPGEDAGQFRARLQQLGREARDRRVAALRQKYAGRVATLEDKLRRARQGVDRQSDEASGATVDTAVSIGTAVLGALLGRKRGSGLGSAVRRTGNLRKQSADVQRARESVAALEQQLEELEAEVKSAVQSAGDAYDAQTEVLEEIPVRPKAADVTVQFCGVGWLPHIEDATGNLEPAYGTGPAGKPVSGRA